MDRADADAGRCYLIPRGGATAAGRCARRWIPDASAAPDPAFFETMRRAAAGAGGDARLYFHGRTGDVYVWERVRRRADGDGDDD